MCTCYPGLQLLLSLHRHARYTKPIYTP
jgi:hypothetical protein